MQYNILNSNSLRFFYYLIIFSGFAFISSNCNLPKDDSIKIFDEQKVVHFKYDVNEEEPCFQKSDVNDIRMQTTYSIIPQAQTDSMYLGFTEFAGEFPGTSSGEYAVYNNKNKLIKLLPIPNSKGLMSFNNKVLYRRSEDGKLLQVNTNGIDTTNIEIDIHTHRVYFRDSILIQISPYGDIILTNLLSKTKKEYRSLKNSWAYLHPTMNIFFLNETSPICPNCLVRFKGTEIDLDNVTKIDKMYDLRLYKNYITRSLHSSNLRHKEYFVLDQLKLVPFHIKYLPNVFSKTEKIEYEVIETHIIKIKGNSETVLFNLESMKVIDGSQQSKTSNKENIRKNRIQVKNKKSNICKECKIYSKELELVNEKSIKIPVNLGDQKDFLIIKGNDLELNNENFTSAEKNNLVGNKTGSLVGTIDSKFHIIYEHLHSNEKYRIVIRSIQNPNIYILITRNQKGFMVHDEKNYKYFGDHCKIHIPNFMNESKKNFGESIGISLELNNNSKIIKI